MTSLMVKTSLYPHQIKAVEKLSKIKVGALYMEQGTGKTRTALELVAKRFNANKVNHILWLCPFSVKKTIEIEIKKHVGSLPDFFTICGIETLSFSDKTNHELLKMVQSKRVYLIVDESNLVKNYKALRTESIIHLSEFCKYKLILNGTPISRNEADLFAQWYILDWRILGYSSFWSFANNHLEFDEATGRIVRAHNVDYLVRKIAPYTYQIKKDECLTLPTKHYKEFGYHLTRAQYDHYDDVANQLLFELDELKPYTIYRLLTGIQNVLSGFRVGTGEKLTKKPFFDNPIENPRIQLLLEVLEKADPDKAIIYCKYTQEINDIVYLLNERYGSGSAVAFNGEVKQRQENIQTFTDSARFFVANKTCAGYGLNLQFCNCIIYYSNDWDYATRAQSEDRVHRIGQEREVQIIDLYARHTLDERILSCLKRKESLVDSFKYMIKKMKDRKDLKVIKDWIDGGEKENDQNRVYPQTKTTNNQ
jgi:SNF2 family DNA or RNA helicase